MMLKVLLNSYTSIAKHTPNLHVVVVFGGEKISNILSIISQGMCEIVWRMCIFSYVIAFYIDFLMTKKKEYEKFNNHHIKLWAALWSTHHIWPQDFYLHKIYPFLSLALFKWCNLFISLWKLMGQFLFATLFLYPLIYDHLHNKPSVEWQFYFNLVCVCECECIVHWFRNNNWAKWFWHHFSLEKKKNI